MGRYRELISSASCVLLQYASYQKITMPNNMEVSGTVRLSSSSVLIGRDSTNAVPIDTNRKRRTNFQLPSMYPNEEKYHIYLPNTNC